MLFYMSCRIKSLESAVKLLESVDAQIRLISDQLNQISQKSVNIRSLTVDQSKTLYEDLKV